MNLFSAKEIKNILSENKARPSKGLGQNFLVDKNVLDRLVQSANIKPGDVILEIGPGIGTLTRSLAEKSERVIAIEKDKTMVEILKQITENFQNIEIINDDILKIDLKKYIKKPYKVVANIPYYLTSPLIRKLLEAAKPPKEIVLMVQKEVAQRICAKPPEMSLLAVSVQFYADPKIISYVSKNCFWPSPKVDSAIIKIIPKQKYNIPADLFFKIVKAGFSHPRKQLVNNLTNLNKSNGVKLTKEQIFELLSQIGIKINQRAETLNISDWINIARNYNYDINQ